jgi:hypothetical protein
MTMPNLDPSRLVDVLQNDVKDANEKLRTHILAENERLRDDNDQLQGFREECGRLRTMVEFYETASWFYIAGTVIFAAISVLSGRMYDWVFWLLFCAGAVSFGVGFVSWIVRLRQSRGKSKS